MERFVEYQQSGLTDEGPRQQHHALFARREAVEGPVFEMVDGHEAEPGKGFAALTVCDPGIAVEGRAQALGHYIDHREGAAEIELHLRADVAYAVFDLPDALAAAATAVKEGDAIGVGLRVVSADHAQQQRFATAVRACERPAVAAPDGPVKTADDPAVAVAHMAVGDREGHFIVIAFSFRAEG